MRLSFCKSIPFSAINVAVSLHVLLFIIIVLRRLPVAMQKAGLILCP